MRGWTLIILVVLVGWVILFPPPQFLGPLFENHTLRTITYGFGPLILYTYTAPGRWLLLLIWPHFFDLTLYQFWDGAPFPAVPIAIFAWGFAFAFSYVFWNFIGARFWKAIGRWNPFGWKITRHRPFFLKRFVAIARWYEREFQFGEHATGAFASLWEVLAHEFKLGDIFLGRPKLIIGGMLRPIGLETEKHFITVATTGAYKTSGALIPNLCIHEGSALIIDPKGELARITARRRGNGGGGVRGMKQPTFVLDPYGVATGFKTASYNVFDEMERIGQINPDRPVTYAGKVAQALIPATNQRDPYWDSAARTLVMGLILYVFQGPKEHRNLVRFRTLLMEGDTENYKRLGAGAHAKGDAFDALMVMMQNCPEGPYRHVIVGAASTLSKMAPPQRGGVLTTAMEHTSFLDIPEFRKTMMRSDFLLEDLKNDFVSVYLCLPLNAMTGVPRNWLRMFVMLTIDMMTRVAKAPDPPLLLAMDEFPSLGPLDGLPSAAATLRSYGCRLWLIGQDLNQFETVYPDAWESLIGNAEAIQFMGITESRTVAYLAERLSQHVVITQQDMGEGRTRDLVSERPLRDADQVAKMLAKGGKNQIVWYGSKRPMLLKICPYFWYMPWWYYSKDPDSNRREKFNRWIWRRGKDNVPPDIPPKPPKPPDNKPPKPPDDKTKRPETDAELVDRYFGRGARSPVPEDEPAPVSGFKLPDRIGTHKSERIMPAPVNGTDKVPGTEVTWDKALVNALELITDRLEQKADKEAVVRTQAEDRAVLDRLQKEGEEWRRRQGFEVPAEKAPAERVSPGGHMPSTRPPDRPPAPGSPPPRSSGGDGPRKPPRSPLEDALAELDTMIGLDGVKQQVRTTINVLRVSREREAQGLPDMGITNHLVFTGNPGTGKTTVARIVGKIYKEIGLLKKGHMIECGRNALIGQYIGHTAEKTQKLIGEALDGILFIDEAYTLAPIMGDGKRDPFADEAVATLIAEMENNRERLVIIAAGYKDEMGRFLDSNIGLRSRFKTTIEFEDYSPADLFKIFRLLASKKGLRLSMDAQTALQNLVESLDRGKKGFGNGRTMRNIYDDCVGKWANRLAQTRGPKDYTMFEEADIPKPGEKNYF